MARQDQGNSGVDNIEDHVGYDPEAGSFFWKIRKSGRRLNGRAGYVGAQGYYHVEVNGQDFFGQKLAWYLHHGEWPPHEVDHIDGNPSNNRLVNLRLATHQQNCSNRRIPITNTSGIKGVHWHKAAGKWAAVIKVNQRGIHLGTFENKEDAAKAYWEAAQKYHGKFARVA